MSGVRKNGHFHMIREDVTFEKNKTHKIMKKKTSGPTWSVSSLRRT